PGVPGGLPPQRRNRLGGQRRAGRRSRRRPAAPVRPAGRLARPLAPAGGRRARLAAFAPVGPAAGRPLRTATLPRPAGLAALAPRPRPRAGRAGSSLVRLSAAAAIPRPLPSATRGGSLASTNPYAQQRTSRRRRLGGCPGRPAPPLGRHPVDEHGRGRPVHARVGALAAPAPAPGTAQQGGGPVVLQPQRARRVARAESTALALAG